MAEQPKAGAAKDAKAPIAPKKSPELILMEKQVRFKKIAGSRLNNALHQMDLLKNCTNTQTYSYTPDQVNKVVESLMAMAQEVREAFSISAPKENNKIVL